MFTKQKTKTNINIENFAPQCILFKLDLLLCTLYFHYKREATIKVLGVTLLLYLAICK